MIKNMKQKKIKVELQHTHVQKDYVLSNLENNWMIKILGEDSNWAS